VSDCCGLCCPHIEGTCPDYQSRAHASCGSDLKFAQAFGIDYLYPDDYYESVDGEMPQ